MFTQKDVIDRYTYNFRMGLVNQISLQKYAHKFGEGAVHALESTGYMYIVQLDRYQAISGLALYPPAKSPCTSPLAGSPLKNIPPGHFPPKNWQND